MSARRRIEARLWFGVLAAPLAWAAEHVAGYGFSEAACDPGGGASVPGFHVGAAVISGACVLVAVAGLVCGLTILRSTGSEHDPPPDGRRHFLAVVAVTVSPLFMVLLIMSAVGALAVDGCRPA